MTSNGIRFSISDLTPSTARILPTLYSYRNGISLYEAQYDEDGNQIPIPEDIIQSVIGAFLRFQIFCSDFGVPFKNIRIIATEATRKAINGQEFVDRVARETGLTVEVLSQADEGETGAWGIASSASDVRGLVMDLGGGSTQITWIMTKDGNMKTSPNGAFSFPYGAAALTQKLELIEKKSKSEKEAEARRQALRSEMKANFLKAYNGLEMPDELVKKARKNGGFTLYLSGGGFRGWGYLLMYRAQMHKKHYPISIINGFVARKKDFTDTRKLRQVARDANRIFRVSDRRRAQVPAVAFLVNVLSEIIPYGINEAHFCQGGVREGVLYQTLPPEIRMQGPIEVATAPHARPLSPKLAKLLRDAMPRKERPALKSLDCTDIGDGWDEVPSESTMRKIPKSLTKFVLDAFANMLYVHSDMSKELSSAAALYTTSSGVLADTHGTSHRNRALLALLLEARYTGDLPPREFAYREALRRLVTPAERWWINYLGSVALVLGMIYPAGGEDDMATCDDDCECLRDDEGASIRSPVSESRHNETETRLFRPHHKKPHLSLHAHFADDLGESGSKSGLRLTFKLRMREHNKDDPMKVQEALENLVHKIVKTGKRKNWVQVAEDDDDDSDDDDSDNDEGDDGFFSCEEDSDSSDGDSSGDDLDDDGNPGWGMKVEVQIEVHYPKELRIQKRVETKVFC